MDLTTVEHLVQFISSAAPVVLAVDDHEDSLILMADVLELMGCACVTARNGKDTLSQARICQPDVILLDIVLPDINGMMLLGQLQAEHYPRKITAIAVTGLASPEERARIQKAGFDDYLCKPYRISDLECLLRRHLDGKLAPGRSLNGSIEWV